MWVTKIRSTLTLTVFVCLTQSVSKSVPRAAVEHAKRQVPCSRGAHTLSVSFKDFLELSIKYKDNSTLQPHLYFQMSVIERLEKTSISQIWRFKPKLNLLHLV